MCFRNTREVTGSSRENRCKAVALFPGHPVAERKPNAVFIPRRRRRSHSASFWFAGQGKRVAGARDTSLNFPSLTSGCTPRRAAQG